MNTLSQFEQDSITLTEEQLDQIIGGNTEGNNNPPEEENEEGHGNDEIGFGIV